MILVEKLKKKKKIFKLNSNLCPLLLILPLCTCKITLAPSSLYPSQVAVESNVIFVVFLLFLCVCVFLYTPSLKIFISVLKLVSVNKMFFLLAGGSKLPF